MSRRPDAAPASIVDAPWQVAITTARERIDTLVRCIDAAGAASARLEGSSRIDVLVNGNRPLATAAVQWLRRQPLATPGCGVRIWFIEAGDKSNAWNEYVHRIAGDGELHFFVDGYVVVRADAFARLADGLHAAPAALAATGVPTAGRTAALLRAQLLSEGGIHGNLFALRGSTLRQLRGSGFRLPLRLYRGDSLINAVLSFRFDPGAHDWDRRSVLVQPAATWDVVSAGNGPFQAVASRLKRMVRQAQGRLEVGALREHLSVARRSPLALPASALELVEHWMARQPAAARRLFRAHPSTGYALLQMRRGAAPPPASRAAELLADATVQ